MAGRRCCGALPYLIVVAGVVGRRRPSKGWRKEATNWSGAGPRRAEQPPQLLDVVIARRKCVGQRLRLSLR